MIRFHVTVRTEAAQHSYDAIGSCSCDIAADAYDRFGACAVTVRALP